MHDEYRWIKIRKKREIREKGKTFYVNHKWDSSNIDLELGTQ